MPLNIRIEKDQLEFLTTLENDNYRITKTPMKTISQDNKTFPDEETFIAAFGTGNILFRPINDIFQISSCTDTDPKRTIISFAKVCEENDIAYTAIGFESNF